MSINIKLQVFEGPFDLLFHLIQKSELDIYDIPISEITEQYLQYISMMENLDLEIASEFLLMAATLLEIKSKTLLPKPKKEENIIKDDIDPREELVKKLLEYKKYKEVSAILKDKLQIYEKAYYKPPEPIEDYIRNINEITELPIEVLFNCFTKVLERNIDKKEIKQSQIYKEEFTIDKKILDLTRYLKKNSTFYFDILFNNCSSKQEIIVTFLALLELIKRELITFEQENNFDRIIIRKIDNKALIEVFS